MPKVYTISFEGVSIATETLPEYKSANQILIRAGGSIITVKEMASLLQKSVQWVRRLLDSDPALLYRLYRVTVTEGEPPVFTKLYRDVYLECVIEHTDVSLNTARERLRRYARNELSIDELFRPATRCATYQSSYGNDEWRKLSDEPRPIPWEDESGSSKKGVYS